MFYYFGFSRSPLLNARHYWPCQKMHIIRKYLVTDFQMERIMIICRDQIYLFTSLTFKRSQLHRMVEWREHPSNRVESITNIKSSVNLLGWNFMAFYPSECKYEDIWKISELNNSYICGPIHLHREYIGVRLHILAFTWRNYK